MSSPEPESLLDFEDAYDATFDVFSLARPDSLASFYKRTMEKMEECGKHIPPLLKPSCKFLQPRPHQKTAVSLAMVYLFSKTPGAFHDFDTDVLKDAYEVVDQTTNEEDNIEQDCASRPSRKRKASETVQPGPSSVTSEAVLTHNAIIRPMHEPRGCKLSIPCGGGKTAIIILLALLHGGPTLVITNNAENALQIVKTIISETNIHLFAKVKLIRLKTNGTKQVCESSRPSTGGKQKLPLSEEDRILEDCIVKDTFVTDGEPNRRHFLPNGACHGITVLDFQSYKELPKSSDGRTSFRQKLYQSFWPLVLFDEADSVFTHDTQKAFGEGVRLDFDDNDGLGQRTRIVPFRFKHAVYMSGTWFRGDEAGREFLRNAGKTLYVERGVDLERRGLLAKVRVTTIVCKDDEWAAPFMDENQQLRGASPDKCRILELLVTLHLYYGHKIMIFSRYLSQVATLRNMFPSAFVVDGASPDRERLKRDFLSKKGAIWATTSIGSRGFDTPDVSVVINFANYGESPAKLSQRMGRALRDFYQQAWMYDLVSGKDQNWCKSGIIDDIRMAERYAILKHDGYLPRMNVLLSEDVRGRVMQNLTHGPPGVSEESIPDISYDSAVVQVNHVLSFFRGSTKIDDASETTTGKKLTTKAPASKVSPTNPKMAMRLLAKSQHGSQPLRKGLLRDFEKMRRASSSALVVSQRKEAEASSSSSMSFSLPSNMPTHLRNECSTLQDIIARSNHPVLDSADDPLSPDALWKIIKEIQNEAMQIMSKNDNERHEVIRSNEDFVDDLQGACEFP